MKHRKYILLFGAIVFLIFSTAFKYTIEKNRDSENFCTVSDKEHGEKFSPGDFVMSHILTSYEWHITTINGKHISIPLPIILYSRSEKNKGLYIFLSSKFEHGHKAYRGFKIETRGKNKGKIVELRDEEKMEADPNAPLPIDLSISKTVAGVFVSIILLLIIFLSVARRYKRYPDSPPRGIQSLFEPVILFIRDDIARPIIGKKKYQRFIPYLLSVFFFILFNNLLGLIPIFPGGANVTGNINVTAALAIFTFIITLFSAKKYFWKHIFNPPGVPWWLKVPIPLMPLIEFTGVFIKHIVLCIRLFANMSAGHIVAIGFISIIFIFGGMSPGAGYGVSIISLAFAIFMILLDILVSFIQAYVFTILSALYFSMAIEEEH